MNPAQNNSQSRTLTNPPMSHIPLKSLLPDYHYEVKQQEDHSSHINSYNQNLTLINNSTKSLPKQQIQLEQHYQQLAINKQSSLENNNKTLQLYQSDHSLNANITSNSNYHSFSQLSQRHHQPNQHNHQNQSISLNQQHKQDQQLTNHNMLIQHNTQTNLEHDYIANEFILPGADFQNNLITFTIMQKLTKTTDNNLNSNDHSEQQLPLTNSIKMEVQYPDELSRSNLQQQQSLLELNQPITNIKEMSFHLTDPKEKRQLRRLTPIKSLKKYILQKFGYSSGAQNCQHLQLFFYNLYPNQSPDFTFPINDQQNLQLILSQYLKARRHIFITFQNNGSLKKKVQRKPKFNETYQIQFDSDGQLQDEQLSSAENSNQNQQQDQQYNQIKLIKKMIMVNKTQKSRYKGSNLVRCAFCRKANKDIQSIKICGPFYGPFTQRNKKTKHYCHLLCALWCKKVFLNDKNELEKIPMEIARSEKKMCEYCDNFGAGLLCNGCNAAMHYECGLQKCQYQWPKYELFCLKCKQERNELIEIEGEQNQVYEVGQPSQIQAQINIDAQVNIVSMRQGDEAQQLHPIKTQLSQQIMKMEKVMSINIGQSFSLEDSGSRTKSIPNPRTESNDHNKLTIDPMSKLYMNGQEQQSVQILQSKCKPGKHKIPVSNLKIQETKLLRSSEKPRRGRRPKQNKNK